MFFKLGYERGIHFGRECVCVCVCVCVGGGGGGGYLCHHMASLGHEWINIMCITHIHSLSDYMKTVHSRMSLTWRLWHWWSTTAVHNIWVGDMWHTDVTNCSSCYAWYGFYILRSPSVASRCQVVCHSRWSVCMFWRPSAIRSRATVTEIIGPHSLW